MSKSMENKTAAIYFRRSSEDDGKSYCLELPSALLGTITGR